MSLKYEPSSEPFTRSQGQNLAVTALYVPYSFDSALLILLCLSTPPPRYTVIGRRRDFLVDSDRDSARIVDYGPYSRTMPMALWWS